MSLCKAKKKEKLILGTSDSHLMPYICLDVPNMCVCVVCLCNCVSVFNVYVCVCVCVLPSVLILSAVLTRANSVALNITVPSLFRGMFIDTRRCRKHNIVFDRAEFEKKMMYLKIGLSAANRCWQLIVC